MTDITFGHLKFKTLMQDKSLTYGFYAITDNGDKLIFSGVVGKETPTELRMIAEAVMEEWEVIEERSANIGNT